LALLQKTIQTDIASENFIEKNYTIKGYQIAQKSVISLKTPAGMFYELQNKENQIGNFESLVQNLRNLLFIRWRETNHLEW
jgi:hypothetical protein